MLIQYYLADGQEVKYDTGSYPVSVETVNQLAMIYARMRPFDLPTDVFMHVSVYADFVQLITPMVHMGSTKEGLCVVHIRTRDRKSVV